MKTLSELEALSDDELRVMLGKLDGWRLAPCYAENPYTPWWERANSYPQSLPNYPADLNACHAVAISLPQNEGGAGSVGEYHHTLGIVCDHPFGTHYADATARQRSIALILTLQS